MDCPYCGLDDLTPPMLLIHLGIEHGIEGRIDLESWGESLGVPVEVAQRINDRIETSLYNKERRKKECATCGGRGDLPIEGIEERFPCWECG